MVKKETFEEPLWDLSFVHGAGLSEGRITVHRQLVYLLLIEEFDSIPEELMSDWDMGEELRWGEPIQ